MTISRRDALAEVAAMFAGQLFAPIARAVAATGRAAPPVIRDGPPSIKVFTPIQRATMAKLSDRVIPTTDTPGAIAAEVPEYIEKLLADWALTEDRMPIVAGLDAIDARSRAAYGVPAAQAKPDAQDALLALAMNDGIPGGADFFVKFRQLVVTGYYTSEIGMTQEREYLPMPGRYDGAYPYANVNKVFSA